MGWKHDRSSDRGVASVNVAIAGWLTWVRIVRPDRKKLQRERERKSIGDGFPAR